jgi:uncharacterized protein YceH (UPF0502 family)
VDLQPAEIRVLGCLLEKQRTTPDAYPLSLNALRLACNQATNREPVVDYDDATVRDALHRLGRRRMTRLASGAGSRAPKYRHLLEDALPMGRDESAVLCVLMLRGPQTPGELKQRAERMHPFADLAAIGTTLGRLIERGLVARLERRPGQKEERYRELLGEDAEPADGAPASRPVHPPAGDPAPRPLPAPAGPPAGEPAPRPTGGPVPGLAAPGAGPRDRPAPSGAELEARVARLERSLATLGDERLARLEREVAELREALGG